MPGVSDLSGLTSAAPHFGHEAAADSIVRPGSRPPQIGAPGMVLPFDRALDEDREVYPEDFNADLSDIDEVDENS
ncbi:hypothetical protein Purlil1_12391 [Purpureocillium lilacinum]|uniref:Uncharacterized protein n=1 Tax=Purpureocillium lilacinum TaxID=33203 RepID=A0ABR0BHL1_PURLI|nr:hypothetical protein Purlil1_12391 [Purpureocillium lilacinum]